MKNFIQYITVSIILALSVSCNDDFIKKDMGLSRDVSSIVISPDWEAQGYMVYCEGAGNAKFTVANAPEWLDISMSGQFTDDVAILICKANPHSDFSNVGFYHASIILSIEGIGNQFVPVSYIIEGNPVIEIEDHLIIKYNTKNNLSLTVKNTGHGSSILLWSVVQLPEWLSLVGSDGKIIPIENYPIGILQTGKEETFRFIYNPDFSFSGNLSGKIVINSNDKNKSVIEISVNTIPVQQITMITEKDEVSIYISCSSLTTIDWGDNSVTEIYYSTSLWYNEHSHRYSEASTHTITITGDITHLHSENNQLTSLSFSDCTALTRLYCQNNQLMSLDVSGCMALIELNCYNNQLTDLYVSGCTVLDYLDCNNNQLTGLDMSGCTALRSLNCRLNKMEIIALDAMFETLHYRVNGILYIGGNPGTADCNVSIATNKRWYVFLA